VTARVVSWVLRVSVVLLLALALMAHVAGGAVPGDGDGDGYTPPADCNDANAEVHPGAVEVPFNRIDENCDGWLADADSDGFNAPADCDDSEPNVHPGAQEFPRNVIDENCDGRLADSDGDGFDSPADCDDSEPNVHPGAQEFPRNVIDENCDGRLADADGDGFDSPRDCDDSEPNVHPGAREFPRNVIDENCDGRLADADGDGFDAPRDCDDSEPGVRPGGREVPNNRIDEDCDGRPPWPRAKVGVTLKSKTLKNGVTRLLALRLTGLRARDTLQVLCRSRGCGGRIDYRGRMHRNHGRLNLSRVVRNRRLQPGVRLRVRVGRRNRAASVVTFITRRRPGKRPLRELRCQWPQERALRPC
jgi:hypothetical protein